MASELTQKPFSAVAPFQRIEQDIRRRLMAGEWEVGSMLPSRRELAKQYSVELKTLQRAMAPLLDDQLLWADGKRGTLVISIPKAAPAERSSDNALAGAMIGVLHPGLYIHTWSQIFLRTVDREFSRAGASSVFRRNTDAPTAVRELISRGCAAIIIDGIHGVIPIDEILATVDGRVPVVFVSNEELKRPVLSVYYDSFDAGYQVGEHLAKRGYQDILYVAGCDEAWVQHRLNGLTTALAAAGLPAESLRLSVSLLGSVDGQYNEAGYEAASQAFAEQLPDAVVGCNDRTALGVARAVAEYGKTVGQDIALIGFDDDPEARVLGLPTLQPPLEEMAVEAARLAASALTKGTASQRSCLHSHLIERSSTASKVAVRA